MADAIIFILLDRLASTVHEYVDGEVKLVLDAKKDVEEFAGNLRAIQAVLEDAEQRQAKEASVRIWLDQLKDISFQMVDVLDEWNTDMLRQQVEKQEREGEDVVPEEKKKKKKKKVTLSVSPSCFCFRKAKEVIFSHKIASKIKDLNERLSVIAEQRKRYGFQQGKKDIQELPERQKTSSFVVLSEVFGRDKEKDILITKLLSDGGEDRRALLIIPILGMGGMGKTTLAQLVYNDDKVKAYFEKRVWVCVSDPFDEIKIAKAISGDDAQSSNELDRVLHRMSTSIEGKNFLLVLDDVWTHDREKWEKLRAPLIQSGAHGSKILVTTRKHEVVDMMRATNNMINLKELSEEYCLSIFNHMTFADTKVDEYKAFEDISKDLVKKCKGLPLAAKALGSLMHNKKTRREWLGVLNSKIWDREEMEQEVFQPLLLSYYDLALAVKCCLLYCATFPKDYEFERDNLINLWMSQDYLNSKGNTDKGEVGDAIFDNLVARSFFQDLKKHNISGKIMGCKMHDIVHDFVQSLAKNECLTIDTEGVGNELEVLGAKVRHLTVMIGMDNCRLPPSNAYFNCKNLRTFTKFGSHISTIDSNFILQQKCLRTLNLSRSFIDEVPKEIGKLVHLRHLDLSWNGALKILPDSVCELYNLYTLRLDYCRSLEKLPDNMGKLISLRKLYVMGCFELEHFPKGFRRLKNLKTLDACVVVCGESHDDEDRAALQVEDLRVFNLEGSFGIRLKGNVKDEREIEKAQLWHMNQLFHLGIDCKDVQYKQTSSTVEILNILRPHENLESLYISYHSGTTCPNWIMSLHNLRSIFLSGWSECMFLPPLGKLPYLEKLTIMNMERVEKVGGEFLGIDKGQISLTSSSSSSCFPKLKQLEIGLMDALEEWEVGVEEWNKEDSEIPIMPCLSSLKIYSCPLLKTLPDFFSKTPLQDLIIEDCPSLSERCEKGNGEEWSKISHTPNIIH